MELKTEGQTIENWIKILANLGSNLINSEPGKNRLEEMGKSSVRSTKKDERQKT